MLDAGFDGAATRVAYGILNLTRRDSHEFPEPMNTGEFNCVRLRLNEIGNAIARGSRIRLSISTTFCPLVWPSPETAAIGVKSSGSLISLPSRLLKKIDDSLADFEEQESAMPLEKKVARPPESSWQVNTETQTGEVATRPHGDEGKYVDEDCGDWTVESTREAPCSIRPGDAS